MKSITKNIALHQFYPLLSTVLRMAIRIPALIFDLPVCSLSRKISPNEQKIIIEALEPGDIVLVADKLFPLWRFAVAVMGSPRYSHTAIYEGQNYVVEATTFHPSGCGVARTSIADFLSGPKNICVVRPPYPSSYNKDVMLTWLCQQLGKPYDYGFGRNNSDAMYCSKLVAAAMQTAGLTIQERRFMGLYGYAPDDFLAKDGMSVVYRKSQTFVEKGLSILPFLLGALLWITGMVPLLIVCLILLAAGWLQYVYH